jgi:3',5'-cyclic-AMP phosphodiesterase
MTRIAHLTDLHLNGTTDHAGRFVRVLARAREAGAQHLVLTGDLTQAGKDFQFDELSMLLNWHPRSVTLVPGNHDGDPANWMRALGGPLARFAPTSAPGTVIELGDAEIVPINTQIRQPPFLARGMVSEEQLHLLDRLTRARRRPLLIAMHHGPQRAPLQPLDGLVNRRAIQGILNRSESIYVLCGHDHRIMDMGRIFTAGSVAEHKDPLRIYDITAGRLQPVYRSPEVGQYMLLRDYAAL